MQEDTNGPQSVGRMTPREALTPEQRGKPPSHTHLGLILGSHPQLDWLFPSTPSADFPLKMLNSGRAFSAGPPGSPEGHLRQVSQAERLQRGAGRISASPAGVTRG